MNAGRLFFFYLQASKMQYNRQHLAVYQSIASQNGGEADNISEDAC